MVLALIGKLNLEWEVERYKVCMLYYCPSVYLAWAFIGCGVLSLCLCTISQRHKTLASYLFRAWVQINCQGSFNSRGVLPWEENCSRIFGIRVFCSQHFWRSASRLPSSQNYQLWLRAALDRWLRRESIRSAHLHSEICEDFVLRQQHITLKLYMLKFLDMLFNCFEHHKSTPLVIISEDILGLACSTRYAADRCLQGFESK